MTIRVQSYSEAKCVVHYVRSMYDIWRSFRKFSSTGMAQLTRRYDDLPIPAVGALSPRHADEFWRMGGTCNSFWSLYGIHCQNLNIQQ
jgi:hypothetical protein